MKFILLLILSIQLFGWSFPESREELEAYYNKEVLVICARGYAYTLMSNSLGVSLAQVFEEGTKHTNFIPQPQKCNK